MSTRLYNVTTKQIEDVPDEDVNRELVRGTYVRPTQEEEGAALTAPAESTGLLDKTVAGTGELLNTASLGGTDFLVRQLGTEGERKYHEKVRRENPGTTFAGTVAGVLTDPFALGAAAAGIGERTAAKIIGEGTGVGSRIARAGIGGGTEGVIQGAGTTLSHESLSGEPVNFERIASHLSSDALFGGGVGALAGAAGKGLGIAMQTGRARIGAIREGMAAGDNVAADLVGKSEDELKKIATTERETLAADQAARNSTIVDDATAYRQQLRDANPFLVVPGSDLATSTRTIEKALKTPETLAKEPGRLSTALETQRTAIKKTIAEREAIAAGLDEISQKVAQDVAGQVANLAPDAKTVQLTGNAKKLYGQFSDLKIPKGTKSIDVAREDVAAFADALNNGTVRTSQQRSLEGLDGLLESNMAMKAKIDEARIPTDRLKSDRLAQIETAIDSAKAAANRPRSWLEDVAQSSIYGHVAGALTGVPVLGPLIGAKLARGATNLIFGRLGKASAETTARITGAIDKFMSVAPRVAKPVPVLASKVLAQVRYGEQTPAQRETSAASAAKRDLPALFKQRTDEIKAQTAYGPDGKAQMTPAARQKLAARLEPIAVHDPLTADKLEEIGARRLEFLANKIPRRPEIGGIQLGPDKWQPSELEMRQFARYAAAVEDPTAIVERLSTGQVNPEDAEVMRVVYPEMYAQIKAQITAKLPELHKQLPYSKRIALSIFSGVPVDPAMNPQIVVVLQSQFEEEPGSEGGTSAPKASPQFGSVSKPEPTAAQQRSG